MKNKTLAFLIVILANLWLAACSDSTPTALNSTASATNSTGGTVAATTPLVTIGTPDLWNFDSDVVGSLPKGATSFSGQWVVQKPDDPFSAPNVLCQTAEGPDQLLKLSDNDYQDFTLNLRFYLDASKRDQVGGLVFRMKDPKNYYILIINGLEGGINLYNIIDGKQLGIRSGASFMTSNAWHELNVEVRKQRVRWTMDGKLVGAANTDNNYPTGKLGLWTRLSAVTCFDNILVTKLEPAK